MLSQLAFSILERYEKYIESLIQLSMFKTQRNELNEFIAEKFNVDPVNLLPKHLLEKLNASDWLQKMYAAEKLVDDRSRQERLRLLEEDVELRHNDLYMYLNALDKSEVVSEIFPDFLPFTVSLSRLRRYINDVLALRHHRFPLVYFIREIKVKGYSFEDLSLSFDLRYYDLDLMAFFDRVESQVIRIRNKEPLQLSYHYYITKLFTGPVNQNYEHLLMAVFAMIGNDGSEPYNGFRLFDWQSHKPYEIVKLPNGKVQKKINTIDPDFKRISIHSTQNSIGAVGFHCLGQVNTNKVIDYKVIAENTCLALSRRFNDIKTLSFIGKDYKRLSAILYELFFDYPISDEWHLSHKAFFLRYGLFSQFDYYYQDIVRSIYSVVNDETKLKIQSFKGWRWLVTEFINSQESLNISDEVIESISDEELYYLMDDYFFNHKNISSPEPFILPSVFSREELFNKPLNYDKPVFIEKLSKLNAPLCEYIKTLGDKCNISTFSALIESVFNTQESINKRMVAGLGKQVVLGDNLLTNTFHYQDVLVDSILGSLQEIIESDDLLINEKVAQDCSIVCSLRLDDHFTGIKLSDLQIHQLDDFTLSIDFALLPYKATKLTNDDIENLLFYRSVKVDKKAQMYLLSFWLTNHHLLQLIANNRPLLEIFKKRFDAIIGSDFISISEFV